MIAGPDPCRQGGEHHQTVLRAQEVLPNCWHGPRLRFQSRIPVGVGDRLIVHDAVDDEAGTRAFWQGGCKILDRRRIRDVAPLMHHLSAVGVGDGLECRCGQTLGSASRHDHQPPTPLLSQSSADLKPHHTGSSQDHRLCILLTVGKSLIDDETSTVESALEHGKAPLASDVGCRHDVAGCGCEVISGPDIQVPQLPGVEVGGHATCHRSCCRCDGIRGLAPEVTSILRTPRDDEEIRGG